MATFIDPHLLVSQEDIIQEDHADNVDDTVPQDQPRIIERPTTVFVEQKGILYWGKETINPSQASYFTNEFM